MGKTIIISDLHLSQGWDPEKKRWSKLEDFFFDEQFKRFLNHLKKTANNQEKIRLITNGDLVCFQQVKDFPKVKQLFGEEIFPKETHLGLGTTIEKTKWKLDRIMEGHDVFFKSLAEFLTHGHELYIIPGNHDIEFTYPELQDYFKDELSRLAQNQNIKNQIHFNLWFYYDHESSLYVEHGNQYEQLNSFDYLLYPYLEHFDPKDKIIMLPLGSFLIRYFFNRLEGDFPFADNIKPAQRFARWLLFNPRGWKKFPTYIYFLFKSFMKTHKINKDWKVILEQRHKEILEDIAVNNDLEPQILKNLMSKWVPSAINKRTLFFVQIFPIRRLLRDYLKEAAPEVRQYTKARFIIFGHSHGVDYQILKDKDNQEFIYCNSGTWNTIFPLSFKERMRYSENEFVVIEVSKNDSESIGKGDYNLKLLKWNDNLKELEKVRLFD